VPRVLKKVMLGSLRRNVSITLPIVLLEFLPQVELWALKSPQIMLGWGRLVTSEWKSCKEVGCFGGCKQR